MAVEKSFCIQVKEQIVDEKHAAEFYDHLIEMIDTPIGPLLQPPKPSAGLLKALLNKIATDERSHLNILMQVDLLLCPE